jgi:integrase
MSSKAELAHLRSEYGGLHFHDLRHTHATWLIALRVPMIAVAGRLGHANAVVTMMVYAHVDKLADRGLLTVDALGTGSSRASTGSRDGASSGLELLHNSLS